MRVFLLSQLLLWLIFQIPGNCQVMESSVIDPFPLKITTSKTTNLIFPFAIKTVDRGSRDILTQKPAGVENILQVKAARTEFDTTNLTVITADGKLYSFLVSYSGQPLSLNIQVSSSLTDVANFGEHGKNEAKILRSIQKTQTSQVQNVCIKDKSSQVRLLLTSIFASDDLLLYKIEFTNNSALSYNIENFRFFVRDKKTPKRTAIQETEIKPLHILGDTSTIAARSSHCFVFALSKMTIPDKKYMAIQLQEKNGGRHLLLKVRNRHLLKAFSIQ